MNEPHDNPYASPRADAEAGDVASAIAVQADGSITVPYVAEIADSIEASVFLQLEADAIAKPLLRHGLLAALFCLVPAVWLVYEAWQFFEHGHPLAYVLLAGAVGMTWLGITRGLFRRRYFARRLRLLLWQMYGEHAASHLFGPRTVTLSPRGVTMRSAHIELHCDWSAIDRIVPGSRALYFYVGPAIEFQIPRRAFADETQFSACMRTAQDFSARR